MIFNIKAIVHYIFNKCFQLDLTPIDHSVGWGLRDKESYLFLWGCKTANMFKEKNNVKIVGNPLTDDLYNGYYDQVKNVPLGKQLGLDNTKKTILLSAECLSDHDRKDEVLYWYKNIADMEEQYNLIIKVHPRDMVGNFDIMLKQSNVVVTQDEYGFRELLKVADINISHYSATSMDAVIYGMPVILLPSNVMGVDNPTCMYWFGADVFIKSYSIESCINYLALVLSPSFLVDQIKREEFILEMFSEYAGNSKIETVNKINELLYD